jgi:AcrR family transcriptional regulator
VKPTSRKKPEELRIELVRAALDLLSEDPESNLDVRTICRRAGRTHTAAYTAFGRENDGGGRHALLASVAARGFAALQAQLERSVVGIDNPVAVLEMFGRTFVDFARERPGLYRLMSGSALRRWLIFDQEPSVNSSMAASAFDEFVKARFGVQNVLCRCISNLRERGGFDPTADEKMLDAWATLHGLVDLYANRQFGLVLSSLEEEERYLNNAIRRLVSNLQTN